MRALTGSSMAIVVVGALVFAACGGDAATTPVAGSGGAAATASTASSSSASDATTATGSGGAGGGGGAAIAYPAPHPAPPSVITGGTVMKHPKIVNVSFAGDPLEADIDAFATAMGTTTYWGDRTAEYGVDPIIPIARIHSAFAPPATFDDSALSAWLVSQLDGTHPEWPAPDESTLYALYFPPGVTITEQGGSSCSAFHGYHDNATLPSNAPVAYAVISRCDSIPEDANATGIQYVSAVASHEVIEAITDPFVETNNLGYAETDPAHLAFSFIGLAELGDMCALIGNAFYTPPDFPYLVQRIWSNKAALTGGEPCLPKPAGQVYFNTAPVLTDTVSFDVGGQKGSTKGVHIPVGETKTVELDLYSEAATPGPWKVSVGEDGGDHLDLSLDHSTGVNGDKIMLTIHVKSENPTYGSEVIVIQSSLGSEVNLWVGLVGN